MADQSPPVTVSTSKPSIPAPVNMPSGHGAVGTREQQFTSLLTPDHTGYDIHKLFVLAGLMKGDPDTVKDGPDPEENLWMPAGYTYFGQFVDHDLTFDSTSSLNKDVMVDTFESLVPSNLRTPRFDLDCVYGDGPDAQPFMYDSDGATLLLGSQGQNLNGIPTADFELLRAPNGRAIIGDKRNDENSIVNQIQQGFIKCHNAVVAILGQRDPATWTAPNDLFKSARNEIRWTYQNLILTDFLPRIAMAEVLADLHGKTKAARAGAYVLYTESLRSNLPREFVVAAYRFGHSGVRFGYRLNRRTRLSIFPGSDADPGGESLLGFDPLPKSHVIDDWARFFPTFAPGQFPDDGHRVKAGDGIDPKIRLQFAYKLDPTIVDPLGNLPIPVAGLGTTQQAIATIDPDQLPSGFRPSLALLNLLRGNDYRIRNGQAFAGAIRAKIPAAKALSVDHMVVRVAMNDKGDFKFVPIDPALQSDTPLWFYVLAEAQAPIVDFFNGKPGPGKPFSEDQMVNGPAAKTQLGWVGGRIVAEVFYGLIDSDSESLNAAPPTWKPIIAATTVKEFLEFPATAAAIA